MATNERKIITTLALNGEKEYKNAMNAAYSGLRVLSSELKANSAEYATNAKSIEGLTKRDEILRKEIAQQKEIVRAATQATEEAAKAYGESSTKTDQYRIKLNNAKAALSNMENALAANNKALADAKSKTKAVSDALETASKKLKTAGTAMENAGNKMRGMSTAAAGAIVAVTKLTGDSGAFADELNTLSAQTGVSTQTLQEWTYAAKFIDTEVTTMTGSMAKMIKQMDAARDGTGDSAAAFKQLNVNIADSNGQLRDSKTVFMETIDALGRVKNETERDALSLQIFGRSAMDLNPLIKAGSAELTKYSQEAHNLGIVMNDSGITVLQKYDDTMQRLKAQFAAARNEIAVQFAPVLEKAGDAVSKIVKNIAEKLAAMNSEQIETALKIAAIVAAAAPMLIIMGKLSTGIGAVSKALSFMVANPAVLTIAALAALTVGVIALSESMRDHNTVAEQLSKKTKTRTTALRDQEDAYYDLKDAQEEQAEADMAQLSHTESLWAELQSLADATGRVTVANQTRAAYILGELNDAYGTEYALVDGMIVKYQDMQTEIDNLIEKKKYEIVQKAAMPLYEKAITDEINLRMNAERDLAALEEAKAAREEEYTKLVTKYGQERLDSWTFYEDGVAQINAAAALGYNTLNVTITDLEKNYETSTAAIKRNLADQTSYQSAELLAQQGNWEEAYAILSWYASESGQKYQELQGDEQAKRLFLQSEYDLAEAALTTYLNNVLNGTEEFNETTVRSLTANATDLYNKAKEAGVNVGGGMIQGMDNKQPGVTTSIKSISDLIVSTLKSKMGIRSPSTVMNGIGKNVIQGLEDGMESKRTSVSTVASSIGSALINLFKNLFGIHSPSVVMRDMFGKNMMVGWANGITENAGLVHAAFAGVMPDTVQTSYALDVTRNFNDILRTTAAPGTQAIRYADSPDPRQTAAGSREIDYDRLGAAVAKAMPETQIVVALDGKKVGQGTAKYVSETLGKSVRAMLRSGVNVDVSAAFPG